MLQQIGLEGLVRQALQEDAPFGDMTTQAIVPPTVRGVGIFVAKSSGVICGLPIAQRTFTLLDETVQFHPRCNDGDVVVAGSVIAEVEGKLQALLTGERVALNFLQRLSGIATLTRQFVEKAAPYGVHIADTRKTTPTLRWLEKYAVRCGGGINHRFSLSDGVLIKDNHIRAAGSLTEAVRRVRQNAHHLLRVEVEVQNLEQVREALECGVDALLLDNFRLEELQEAVDLVRAWSEQMGQPRPILEVSGGVTLESVEAIAQMGVDIISVGALTHSAPALDISMEITQVF
jgi:nicotinate-nucleotide pyrophosphorylase (carboxylating)